MKDSIKFGFGFTIGVALGVMFFGKITNHLDKMVGKDKENDTHEDWFNMHSSN